MAQLLNKQMVTTKYTNALLRNFTDNIVFLRVDEKNTDNFKILSCFKDLVLDLCRFVDACKIKDIAVITTNIGDIIPLEKVQNRLILILENEASFTYADNRFKPEVGDLLWLNHDITIENHSTSKSIILVIDFEEFLL